MARDFDLEERIQTIRNLERRLALRLIYEWTKTGVIGLRHFGELIQHIRAPSGTESE